MLEPTPRMNPAEEASERTLAAVYASLEQRKNFLVEAGAGAGKTYTLVKTLQFLIKRDQYRLRKHSQKIACITFTNVAKEEILARTDCCPLIYCDTIHGFSWSIISSFQKYLKDALTTLPRWKERIEEIGGLGERVVAYTLGHPSLNDGYIFIHHDDVLDLTIALMRTAKFRNVLTSKYPIILIDEYQDTNAEWIASMKSGFFGKSNSPLFGFFGDHWQKIYGDGCGLIEDPRLIVIRKEANFRSVSIIVDCLNRMRPELQQFVANPTDLGSVKIFHTNNWTGRRRTGQHWGGDLPDEVADTAVQNTLELLRQDGWDLSATSTKILMLTHRGLANKQGYDSLPSVFSNNGSFARKEHPHIAFFSDVLEPACSAYLDQRYGTMFLALGGTVPVIRSQTDKRDWKILMDQLVELRLSGTVGAVIDHLKSCQCLRLPNAVLRREELLEQFGLSTVEDLPRAAKELQDLRAVKYSEIVALTSYLAGHSPFETNHGVKGAEFENVMVIVGRGWNQYNFNEMLELAHDATRIPVAKQAAFERNRNLFYVSCSRPIRRLAILFTQELSESAMQTVISWFRADSISTLKLD